MPPQYRVIPKSKSAYKVDELGHRWIVIPIYTVSRAEAERALLGDEEVPLDAENVIEIPPVGCMSCELEFNFVKDHKCPGEPKGYHSDGAPVHYERWYREALKEQRRKNK